MRHALFLTCAIWATPLSAQAPVQLDLAALIALVAEPWRGAEDFETALAPILPRLTIRNDEVPQTVDDPMAWIRVGQFAEVSDLVPVGGYMLCARFGLDTRDMLLQNDLSNRESFDLFSLYQVESDLAEAWPEGAVARLSCQITWNDTRAVAILPEARVRDALIEAFSQVGQRMPPGQAAFYGPDGYRLEGRAGHSDTRVVLDRAEVVLTRRHQAIRVRSFLMNGGM